MIMQNLVRMMVLSIISILSLTTLITSAYAGGKYDDEYKVIRKKDAYRYIKAVSQYDLSKAVIVPVRHAKHGDQVYVPKHGWAYCEFTCELTVQQQYLDFWEDQQERGATSPGHVFDFLTKGYHARDVENYEREKYSRRKYRHYRK